MQSKQNKIINTLFLILNQVQVSTYWGDHNYIRVNLVNANQMKCYFYEVEQRINNFSPQTVSNPEFKLGHIGER